MVSSIELKVTCWTVQSLRGALTSQVLFELVICALEFFATLEWAALDRQIWANATMLAPLFVGNDLGATLASKVYDLELVSQIAVHDRCVKSVCLAARAAHRLV